MVSAGRARAHAVRGFSRSEKRFSATGKKQSTEPPTGNGQAKGPGQTSLDKELSSRFYQHSFWRTGNKDTVTFDHCRNEPVTMLWFSNLFPTKRSVFDIRPWFFNDAVVTERVMKLVKRLKNKDIKIIA